MKILIVRTHSSILSTTAYNVQEIGLAKAYIQAGHQADIVMYGGNKPTYVVKVPTEYGEISVYYMKAWNFLKNGIFPELKRFAQDYDFIQVHEYEQITSWLFYTDRKIRDKVFIYHGPYYNAFNRGYNLRCWLFDHTLYRLKANAECMCFAKSEAAAAFLHEKGFEQVSAVGVGLDTDIWKKLPLISTNDGSANERKDKFNFLYVGKLEPRRNLLFLLDVVDEMLKRHVDVSFTMVGDGEEEYKERCLARVKMWINQGRIRYIPKVNQDEMSSIYAEADCMLFPSKYEIFGMVLMEAIYFGVPVVTSNNGGADMLFRDGENGIVLDCSDEFILDDWINAAERIYSDGKLRENIKKRLRQDSEHLGWNNVAEKILESL